ncbi:MAG TPA: hypothetical protein VJB59_00735 [Bdellovibrionota bacterium]|nr:hypothetical protein [Bdellovibrionota bacterium]
MRNVFFQLTLAALLALTLVYCGRPTEKISNLGISGVDAQNTIETRLKKTKEVRRNIRKVLDALAPFDALLADLAKRVDTEIKVNRKAEDRLLRISNELRQALQEAARGIVEYGQDGSWVIRRKFELLIPRQDPACKTSELEILGQRINDVDEMSVSIQDCVDPKPIVLATVRVFGQASEHLIEMTFDPNALDKLVYQDFQTKSCSIRIKKTQSDIYCEPFEIRLDRHSITVESFEIATTGTETAALIQATLRDHNQNVKAELKLEAQPGLPTRVEVNTRK